MAVNPYRYQFRSIGILRKVFGKSSAPIPVINELSNENLPNGTGRGPFIELPKFKAIGEPSNLLSISLPKSASLNIRNGSIVAINGDLTAIKSEPKSLSGSARYQQLFTEALVSLLVNGTINNKKQIENYSIINVEEKGEEWTILNEQSLIAWTGLNLELVPTTTFDKLSSVKTKGKGVIVVNGSNQLFDITLANNESIIINPNTVIASTISDFDPQILKNNTIYTELIPQSIPKLFQLFKKPFDYIPSVVSITVNQWVQDTKRTLRRNYQSALKLLGLQPYFLAIANYWRASVQFIRLNILVSIAKRKPIYFRLTGPGKLLVNNDKLVANLTLFSKQEIDAIYRTK